MFIHLKHVKPKIISILLTVFVTHATAREIEKPYLYEIKKGDKSSWLFGTLHSGIDFSEVSRQLTPKITAARLVFLEVVRSEKRIQLLQTDLAQALLESPEYNWISGTPLSRPVKERLIRVFKFPSKFVSALRTKSCDQFFVYFLGAGGPLLDVQIESFARSLRKPLRELDLGDLRKLADAADEEFFGPSDCNLEEMVYRYTNAKIDFTGAIESYREGRVRAEYVRHPKEGVSIRNRAWMLTLRPELIQGNVFIAVGLGHFYGEAGLLNLLKQADFEVRRLP